MQINADSGGFIKKKNYNYEITEIENKITSVSGLAINFALTTVELWH